MVAAAVIAPLSVVDYGGGIIITDWLTEDDSNEQIKITVRFLSNEIRSDALDINVYLKKCSDNSSKSLNVYSLYNHSPYFLLSMY